MRIEQLTTEQEALIPVVRDEWLKIGLSCKPLDFDAAKEAVQLAYQSAGLKAPLYYFAADSPLGAVIMASILKQLFTNDSTDQVSDQVSDQVRNQVSDQVIDQVSDQVWHQGRNQVWNQVIDQVSDQVRNQVSDQVWNQAWNQAWNQIYGSHDAYWLAVYDFFARIGLDDLTQPLQGLLTLARLCGWWSPYRGLVILQHRHKAVHLQEGVLHKDGGPSILYRDGFAVWSLNGTHVPQWLAETPTGELDPIRLHELQNAQERREFVRKVGLERIRYKLQDAVLDSRVIYLKTPLDDKWPCHYSVERLNYGNGILRHVLVMDNPSLPEVQHVEYIPTECKTIEQAMNFRLSRTEDQVDDENGSPYWLHGDVIIKPKGAKTFKRWPEVIA